MDEAVISFNLKKKGLKALDRHKRENVKVQFFRRTDCPIGGMKG